jgi:catechol 2,3-dioxygenase-like lactoylglutathione lyase family enzyme
MRVLASLLTSLVMTFAVSAQVFSAEFLALDHVALHVSDLQVSADWYQKCCGFKVLHKWSDVWMVGRGNMKLGLYKTPNAAKVANPDGTLVMDHFAFSVDGDKFQATIDELRAAGIKMTAVEDTGIAYSVFLTDPDGYQVEVTTYHGPGSTPPH